MKQWLEPSSYFLRMRCKLWCTNSQWTFRKSWDVLNSFHGEKRAVLSDSLLTKHLLVLVFKTLLLLLSLHRSLSQEGALSHHRPLSPWELRSTVRVHPLVTVVYGEILITGESWTKTKHLQEVWTKLYLVKSKKCLFGIPQIWRRSCIFRNL